MNEHGGEISTSLRDPGKTGMTRLGTWLSRSSWVPHWYSRRSEPFDPPPIRLAKLESIHCENTHTSPPAETCFIWWLSDTSHRLLGAPFGEAGRRKHAVESPRTAVCRAIEIKLGRSKVASSQTRAMSEICGSITHVKKT